jgi:hypothetical protein
MNKKFSFYDFVLVLIIVFSISLIFVEQFKIHGFAVEGDVPSNVSISKALAIDFSTYLTEGIQFGEINVLPLENVSAVYNYNGTNNSTQYFVQISPDSNINIDICLKADGNLMSSGLDEIGLGNESYSYANETNLTIPSLSNEISFTTEYVLAGTNLEEGTRNYYRFFLDVPSAQASGTYNNSIYFKGTPTGEGC